MTTQARIEAANRAMAEIANDETVEDRRARWQEIFQPIAFALIDDARAAQVESHASDPDFVGVTCDTRRDVFLRREISASGFVYRRFVFGGRLGEAREGRRQAPA